MKKWLVHPATQTALSAFLQDNHHGSAHATALCIFPISSTRTLKRYVLQDRDSIKLIFVNAYLRTFLHKLAYFYFECKAVKSNNDY